MGTHLFFGGSARLLMPDKGECAMKVCIFGEKPPRAKLKVSVMTCSFQQAMARRADEAPDCDEATWYATMVAHAALMSAQADGKGELDFCVSPPSPMVVALYEQKVAPREAARRVLANRYAGTVAPNRLTKLFERANATTLDDSLLCLMATIEDGLIQAGHVPGVDYTRHDLTGYAMPFLLHQWKTHDLSYTIAWPGAGARSE